MLAAGTFTVALLIGLVVAVTPRSSDAPVAVSATTMPATVRPQAAAPPSIAGQSQWLASFRPIPNAVASDPQGARNGRDVAASVPDGDDIVLVVTAQVTYRVAWEDLVFLDVADGAVVVDRDGALVARIERGAIILLVE